MGKNEETAGNQGLTIMVEMGDDFVIGSRTEAALAELVEALADEHGPEVAGFQDTPRVDLRNFAFMSGPKVDGSLGFEAWPAKWKMAGFDGKGNDQ